MKAAKRSGLWWLGRGALTLFVLVFVTLLAMGVLWQWRQHRIDVQIEAQLTNEPIVRGHLGEALSVTPAALPKGEGHLRQPTAYAVRSSLGSGIVVGNLVTDADEARIDDGRLHMSSGLTYPLQDLGTESSNDDPMAMRVEYVAPGVNDNRTGAPDIMIALDAGKAVSEADLMRFTRLRLVPALAPVHGVAVIWSLHRSRQTTAPIMVLSADAAAMEKAGVDASMIVTALESAGFVSAGNGHGYFGLPTAPGNSDFMSSIVVRRGHTDIHLGDLLHSVWTEQGSRMALGLVIAGDKDAVAAAVRSALASIKIPNDIHLRGGYRAYLRLDLPTSPSKSSSHQ